MIINTAAYDSNSQSTRSTYAKRDAAQIAQALNVLGSEFQLNDKSRVTIQVLFGLSGGRREFEASYLTIATQLDKLENINDISNDISAEQPSDKSSEQSSDKNLGRYQKVRRRLEQLDQHQQLLGVPLIDWTPGGMRRDGSKYTSQFKLPIIDMAMDAYDLAHKNPNFGKNPGKAIESAARQVAQTLLAQAEPVAPPLPKPQDLNAKVTRRFAGLEPSTDNNFTTTINMAIQAGWSYDEITARIDHFLGHIPHLHALAMAKLQSLFEQYSSSEAQGGGVLSDVSQVSSLNLFTGEQVETTDEQRGGEINPVNAGEFALFSSLNLFTSEQVKTTEQVETTGEFPLSQAGTLLTDKQGRVELDPVREARTMIAGFQCSGLEQFDLTVTNKDKQPVSYQRALPAEQLIEQLPQVMAEAEEKKLNVIIRPRASSQTDDGSVIVQLDDLDEQTMKQMQPYSFMTILTSYSYQCWLVITGILLGQAANIRKKLIMATEADMGANGAVRLAGSLNVKPIHQRADGTYPRVRLMDVCGGRVTSVKELEELGVLNSAPPCASAPSDTVTSVAPPGGDNTRRFWPDYDSYLSRAYHNRNGKPDISRVDFAWSRKALEKGWSVGEVIEMLLQVSPKARRRRDEYARRTVMRAAQCLRR